MKSAKGNATSMIRVELKRLLNKYLVQKDSLSDSDEMKLKDIYEDVFKTEFREKETNIVEMLLEHFPFFGITSAFKKFQTKESLLEHE